MVAIRMDLTLNYVHCAMHEMHAKQETLSSICPIYPYIVELTAIDWFTCIQSHNIDHYLSLEYVNKFNYIQSF